MAAVEGKKLDEFDVIGAALAVKRGQVRLRDLSNEQRALVATALYKISDARFSELARSSEKRRSMLHGSPLRSARGA